MQRGEQRNVGVRLAVLMLVGTYIDDGIRELRSFSDQCHYLDSASNTIRLPLPVARVYVAASLVTQLVGGGYVLACAVLSPSALSIPSVSGWNRLRLAATCLAIFVASSIVIYGIGQPSSQHAQGRLVFILRNSGMLGGMLLIVAAQQSSTNWRRFWRLVSRLLLALHGLEVAPAERIAVIAAADLVCFPITLMLAVGLYTDYAAIGLATSLVLSDLALNHFWVCWPHPLPHP